MKYRVIRAVSALLAFAGIELSVLVMGGSFAFAAVLSDIAPTPVNSDPPAGHVFLLRKSSSAGVQDDVKLAAYFKNDPGGSTFLLVPGTGDAGDQFVCSTKKDGDTPLNRYISVSIYDATNTGFGRVVYIPYDNACKKNTDRTNGYDVNTNNVFYANYKIPGGQSYGIDSASNMHKVIIHIRYATEVPYGTTAPDLVQQRFRVNLSMNGGLIGPSAQGKQTFPIVGDWDVRDGGATSITVPFGLPCTATSNAAGQTIGLYDADNGIFPTDIVKFYVREETASGGWTRVNLSNPSNGTINSSEVFRPDNGTNKKFASATLTMKMRTKYEMVITGINPRNTIDIAVPGDTIFGAIDCGWKMAATSTVKPTSQIPGGAVTFTHTVRNVGTFQTDPTKVNSTVFWGKSGMKTTGTVANDSRVYKANGEAGDRFTFPSSATGYTIPLTAKAGEVYCQFVRAQPRDNTTTAAVDSTPACVTVAKPPPIPTDTVKIKPVVDDGADIEPTETTTLVGRVEVSNFPKYKDWGYTEYSSQASPQSVRATNYSYKVGTYSGTATQGDCTKSNTSGTCIEWSYSCSDTGVGNYSTAPSCYEYKCASSTSTSYGTSSTITCYDRWRCPSPADTSYQYGSEPTCNVWKCQYSSASAYVSTSPSKSDCEFRCDSGTGAVAHEGSAWASSPCYRPPSFTLICDWVDAGYEDRVTINDDGLFYCKRSIQKVGVTIGVKVCTTLEPSTSNQWSPDPPRPGYGSEDGGKTYKQLKEWGWAINPASAQGCSRVVGKPTVKVFGGDVAVGGLFRKNGDDCSGYVNTSSIVGWPHASAYNASNTELAAFAPKDIYGFATATIGANFASKPRGLAFANTPQSSGDRFGGDFDTKCIADHNDARPPGALDSNFVGAVNSGKLDGSYQMAGNAQISKAKISAKSHGTLYVDGDVYINGNIEYQRSGWAETSDIPSFKLVAFGGDIYIDKDVDTLDGIYVAQPKVDPVTKTTVGGRIYTCTVNKSIVPNSQLYNTSGCTKNKLTVNGVFIAKQVNFGRTKGTAIFGETSEQFNYLPELWLSLWPKDNTTTEAKYDSIISLPPTL